MNAGSGSTCFATTSATTEPKPTHVSKKFAQSLLEKTGYRWQQTYAPIGDAEAKYDQANAATKLRLNGFSREFVMRTNQLILGLADSGPLNVIGAGITGVQATWEVYNKATQSLVEAADINRRLGKATADQYQNDLRFLLQLRYLTAQQYHLKSQAIDVLLAKDEQLYELAKQKVNAGVGVPLDLTRAEVLVERDHFKKLEAESSYSKAVHDLNELIPDLPGSVVLDPLEYHEIPMATLGDLEKKINDRPELHVAELTLAAVKKLKEEADNERKPTVTFYGEIGTLGTEAFGLVRSPTGSVALQINIPLSNGGYHEGKSAEALGKMNSVEWQQRQVQLETKNQIEVAKSQLEFTKKVVISSKKQLQLAQKSLQLAEHKIKLGSAGNLELINAQNDLATVMDLNVQAVYAYEASKLQFFHLISDLDSYFAIENEQGDKHE